ncbi:MAG: type IV pilus secretin PilQ [Pseudomonadota bacterium]
MNYYLLKIIKAFSVVIFLAVLTSFQVLFPLEIYAQEEDQNEAVVNELVANEDKQSESTNSTGSEIIVSEELTEEPDTSMISETEDDAKDQAENLDTAESDELSSEELATEPDTSSISEVNVDTGEQLESVDTAESDELSDSKEITESPDVYVPGVIDVKAITINEKTNLDETDIKAATKFKSVSVDKGSSGLSIIIDSDGMIKDYKSFTLKKNLSAKLPARIVFDILKIKSPFRKEQIVSVNTKWVSRIRHYASPDKFRFVLETEDDFLNAFSAKPISNGLLIKFGNIEPDKLDKTDEDVIYSKTDSKEQIEEETIDTAISEKAEELIEPKQETELLVEEKQEIDLKPAWVDRIDFLSEDGGGSTITIGTTKPVEYSIKKASDRLLHLQLNNTNIATKQKRPLITTRFNSAVDGIWPIQMPEMEKTSIIAIELREAVTYVMEQTDNIINIHFEASTVLPKPEQDKGIPAWKEVLETVPKDIEVVETEDETPIVSKAVSDEKELSELEQKYTGEKIALDFFDTDIKNVFRILKEVSGKNFAIDKNVRGKVTLSLEKPVPWDQAMDLILKMNQLGMIYEGDIVRIAPLETIKKEQELRRAGLIAEKKAMAEQKALEPLVVEYIPINYASANNEILPHLKKLLTKDRGNVSVDNRTNLIILTDVAEVIKKAKDIVRVLDKVTPQVLIEARIVEATTNFSRDLGVTWGSGIGVQTSSQLPSSVSSAITSANSTAVNNRVGVGPQVGMNSLGGTYGINTSINFPAAAANAGSIGFNFVRIAGTPFMLNAKLQAMEADGEGKVVSSPKIATLDNKEATIKQGLRYPYNKSDVSGNTTTVFENVDLELKVKPHVTPDNRISMVISIKKKDIGPQVNENYSFTTKEAETELLVNDGDTVVIGGIIKTTKSTGESSIPGLSKIPILGPLLFKSFTKTDNKEELLIFITPKIVTLDQKV